MFLLFFTVSFIMYLCLQPFAFSHLPSALVLIMQKLSPKMGKEDSDSFSVPTSMSAALYITVSYCITVWVFTAAIVEDVLHSQHKAMKLAS
jgi:hypothetical protein